jgi:Arc/MetJ family transcription regulator
MRTNVEINDSLLQEAFRLSGARSKRAVIDAALRTYVETKAAEARRQTYRERLTRLEQRTADLRLRQPPSDLLRADRDRQ